MSFKKTGNPTIDQALREVARELDRIQGGAAQETRVIRVGGGGGGGGGGAAVIGAKNLGTGEGLYTELLEGLLNLKGLKAGSNITLTPSSDSVTIAASGGSSALNYWSMRNTSDQSLTSSTLNQVTFATSIYDGGSSVIDTANNRFVVPADGLYLWHTYWRWGATAPAALAFTITRKNGSDVGPLERVHTATGSISAHGVISGIGVDSLTSGDLLTMHINPQGASGVIALGTGGVALNNTHFGLLRIL